MRLNALVFAATTLVTSLMLAFPLLAADASALPAEETQGNVRFLSGGVGEDSVAAFKQAAAKYPLELQFVQKATPKDEFLAGVKVTIRDGSQKVILDTVAKGPFLLAALPAGKYQVEADSNGVLKRQTVDIQAGKHERTVLVWTSPN
jgi:hypothetical protein